MTTPKKSISTRSTTVKAFLDQASKVSVPTDSESLGRLIFAMDATASREPCWDIACKLQSDMFTETSELGQLQVQLCYYQGYGEFYATDWTQNATQLQNIMTAVKCKAGQTQIERIFKHAISQSNKNKVNALVFIGDCVEELADKLYKLAGQLALRSIPVFIFHEGHEPIAERVFRHIAQLTKGAYCRFDQSSAEQLRALLKAVAIYAVGGLSALKTHSKQGSVISADFIKQISDQSK